MSKNKAKDKKVNEPAVKYISSYCKPRRSC